MYKILLSLLLILIVHVSCEITSLKTDPTSNPIAVEDKGEKKCSLISVTVEFNEEPTGKVTVSSTYNTGSISVEKDTPTIYIVSGIELKEGDSLTGFTVSVDGTPVSLNEGVVAPTLICGHGVIVGSSAETSTLPKVTSISIGKSSAVSTSQKGVKYCSNVQVDFSLDQTITDMENLEPVYTSFPILGQKSTHVNITNNVPSYHFLLDVTEGGNLDDLQIVYKGNVLSVKELISFTCKATEDSSTTTSDSNNQEVIVGDPTIVYTITPLTTSGQSSDGVCSVTVEFSLDKTPTSSSDLTISSTSISGLPIITQKPNSYTYTSTFNVNEGGNLEDLKINFKGTPIASSSTVTYSCDKFKVIDVNDGDNDGSTGNSIISNLFSTFYLTSLSLLLLLLSN